MESSLFSRILTKIGIAILAIAFVDLVYLNYWVLNEGKKNNISSEVRTADLTELIPSPTPIVTSTPPSEESSKAEDGQTPVPSPVVKTETIVEKETKTVIQTAQKEIFIPMGSGSTKSNSFVDLAGLEVVIDTTKYSGIESVVFEASIWVEGGNGRAYAQLKNMTDKNPFIESLISTTSSSGELKMSGNIPISSGSKKYGVQAKTDITDFAAHVENARIKITLK